MFARFLKIQMPMKRCRLFVAGLLLFTLGATAQQLQFSQQHGFCKEPFTLLIANAEGLPALPEGATIRYTLDGSEPTPQSTPYTQPLSVSTTTILRAAATTNTERITPITTATYIFVDDVLQQSNTPEGYPDTWGRYTTIAGTAIADYEMDPEMTTDPAVRPHIIEGLQSLPVLSIVTDKNHLFSHENDPDRGGIYIFTGPPVGDATGHGWTRPASIEMFESSSLSTLHLSPSTIDFTSSCGLRLHGGHGRLAEKNPKHSFRLVFKKDYGPSSLTYPLFGEDEPSKFDQLVLRCHFGNSWQHWAEGNRTKAQYTRDVWARRMQRKLGRTSVNALYVNLFINGMYWGLYNLSERVDEQFGKDHLGGKKSDIDVVKIEEDGGNHIEASEGDLSAWEEMLATVSEVGNTSGNDPDEAYTRLATLLDIDAFIDYMLINQYAGNTDWDHHNWYAIRRRGADSEGFRFLCWDSEIIFESPNENILGKNNSGGFPTGIFNTLIKYPPFARRYVARAKELLTDDGLLGEQSVVALWDSLYHTIQTAIYAEAARWGDYRRDVHRWQTAGQLYTVDNHYMAERNRLLNQYFPVRTDRVLNSILSFVNIDDFEAPEGWVPLTASMFHQWDGSGADAQPLDTPVSVSWQMGYNVGGGEAIAGFVGVEENRYADLSDYQSLVLRGTGNGLRILANRLVAHGPWKQIVVAFNDSDPYWDADLQAIVVPLDKLRTMPDTNGEPRTDDFLHLNALKVDWSSTIKLQSAYLIPKTDLAAIDDVTFDTNSRCYSLSGQQVQLPLRTADGRLTGKKGIYIIGGRKFIVK